ncbi:hypothetical protein B4U80_13032 [Leptotrombidium deliense]|uniref:Uncharacterized protein n=1 Tax=Leptotrombidium deliense TaxID=299467 RepID=A0A443SED0_9ACAR|nr:hypothetical protein B4U80_13032 [Leptotrombidium deliense]
MNIRIYSLAILFWFIVYDTHGQRGVPREQNANILLKQVCNNAHLHTVSAMTTAFDKVHVFAGKYVFQFEPYRERDFDMTSFLRLSDEYPKYIKDVFTIDNDEVTLAATDNNGAINLMHRNIWTVCSDLVKSSCKTFPGSQIRNIIDNKFHSLQDLGIFGHISKFKVYSITNFKSKVTKSGYDLMYEEKRFFGCPTSLCNMQVIDALLRTPNGDSELFAGVWNAKWNFKSDIQDDKWTTEHKCNTWANLDAAFYDSKAELSYFFKDHYFMRCDKHGKTEVFEISKQFPKLKTIDAAVVTTDMKKVWLFHRDYIFVYGFQSDVKQEEIKISSVTSSFTGNVNAAVGRLNSVNKATLVFSKSLVYVNINSDLTNRESFARIEMKEFVKCERKSNSISNDKQKPTVENSSNLSRVIPEKRREHNRIPTRNFQPEQGIVKKVEEKVSSLMSLPDRAQSKSKLSRSHSSLTVVSGKTVPEFLQQKAVK